MAQIEVPSEHTEHALVERARSGDPDAQNALVGRHYPRVHTLALQLLQDPDRARDATQDAFLRAFSNLSQFDGRFRFSAWIFRIAVNLIRDQLRQPRRTVPAESLSEEPAVSQLPPADILIREEDVRRARAVMDELSEETRLALLLHFNEGLNAREVAFTLDLTHQAVRLRICRGVAYMRTRLAEGR